MATQLPYDEGPEQESPRLGGLGGLTSAVEPCARELFFDDARAAEEQSSDYQPYGSKSADGQAVQAVQEERPVHEEPGATPEEAPER